MKDEKEIWGTFFAVEKYYIVFERSSARQLPWWSLLLDTKFQHCYIITPLDDGLCLVINPIFNGIETFFTSRNINDLLVDLANHSASAILEYKITRTPRNIPSIMISCASTIANFLCLTHSFFLISPLMLYKKLLKLGACPILYQCPFSGNRSINMVGV